MLCRMLVEELPGRAERYTDSFGVPVLFNSRRNAEPGAELSHAERDIDERRA